jgi:hypothetical protein
MKPLASKLQCSLSIRERKVREIGLHFFSERIALFLELNMISIKCSQESGSSVRTQKDSIYFYDSF